MFHIQHLQSSNVKAACSRIFMFCEIRHNICMPQERHSCKFCRTEIIQTHCKNYNGYYLTVPIYENALHLNAFVIMWWTHSGLGLARLGLRSNEQLVSRLGWVTTMEDHSRLCVDNMWTLWRIIDDIIKSHQIVSYQSGFMMSFPLGLGY